MKKKFIFTISDERGGGVESAPVSSKTTMPQWYKDIPPYIGGEKNVRVFKGTANSTVKNCVPFLEAMMAGYMIVLSEDIQVNWENGNPEFCWRTTREAISFHSFEQADKLPVPFGCYGQVIKFENNFRINTPKGYSLLIKHPANRFDLPFRTLDGFVDTDDYTLPVKFPFFIQDGWSGILTKGTPVAQIIPVKRDDWKHELKTMTEKENVSEHNKYFAYIDRSYKKNFWKRKNYD